MTDQGQPTSVQPPVRSIRFLMVLTVVAAVGLGLHRAGLLPEDLHGLGPLVGKFLMGAVATAFGFGTKRRTHADSGTPASGEPGVPGP